MAWPFYAKEHRRQLPKSGLRPGADPLDGGGSGVLAMIAPRPCGSLHSPPQPGAQADTTGPVPWLCVPGGQRDPYLWLKAQVSTYSLSKASWLAMTAKKVLDNM